ncbi:hypothetical protein HHX47_DHR1002000 [Lentinula edodes]|nr:hypothetical protein HHX47_DHR1002000 [Lentinula edodes]
MTRLPTFSQVLENDASIRLVAGISLLTVAVSLLLSRTLGARRRGSLPPGPPGYPIVGNLFDIPTDDKWKVYAQMARDLGSDIISLRLPIGPSLIILNSAACADVLFVKRSAIYSDRCVRNVAKRRVTYFDNRPRMVVLQELVQAGWNLAIMPYGETFKGRFILSSGYGIQAENSEDPFVSLSERWIKTISHATQRGGFLVDSFPILKIVPSWFPGAGFQKKAQDMKKLTEEVRTVAFKHVQKQVADGTAIRSYASRYLESSKEEQTPEETDAVCSIIGNMYLGMRFFHKYHPQYNA